MDAPLLRRWLTVVSLALGAALSMGSSCLNPCEQLADKICSCEPTEFERQSCKRQTQLQRDQRDITNDDRLECQRMLGTCECRAIAEGQLERCGLSRE